MPMRQRRLLGGVADPTTGRQTAGARDRRSGTGLRRDGGQSVCDEAPPARLDASRIGDDNDYVTYAVTRVSDATTTATRLLYDRCAFCDL